MFIYTLPQLVVNKLLIMGIVWETEYISYIIKFAVSPARKTFQNLQANFYAPYNKPLS